MHTSFLRILFSALLFIATGLSSLAQQAKPIDKIVAKVDNYIVLQSELEIAYLQFIQSQDAKFAGTGPQVKCTVLESMIINKFLLAKAEMDSVYVEESQVDEQLDRRMDYFISQFGTEEKLESYYGKTVVELKSELRTQVREQLIIQKMQSEITSKVKLTPADVKNFYQSIPKDSLPYFSMEVEVGHIVRIPEISTNKRHLYFDKLNSIKERLLKGEDFCTLAKEYSEDYATAVNCGELGFFKKGELVPPFEAAAFQLKPGELSGVVETEYGFHLIQLIERRGNEYSTRHILIKPRAEDLNLANSESFLDSLRTEILNGKITFAEAANLYSLDESTNKSGGFLQNPADGSYLVPTDNDYMAGLLFLLDTMKAGTISPPMRFRSEDNNEAVRLVYLKRVIPAHLANLELDYTKISSAAMESKKNNAINEWFDNNKGEVFIQVSDEYKDCQILISQ